MDLGEEDGNVFAIPDLWRVSKLLLNSHEPSNLLFSNLSLDGIDATCNDLVELRHEDNGFFNVPDLCLTSRSPSSAGCSIAASELHPTPPGIAANLDEDIWLLQDDETSCGAQYYTWDTFEDHEHEEPYTTYITEAGPEVFDAAIAAEEAPLAIRNAHTPVVDVCAYTTSLHALGLGRTSGFFERVAEKNTFQPTLSDVRLSGYTVESLKGIQVLCMECGNFTVALRNFVNNTYSQALSPTKIALANAVNILLESLETRLGGRPIVFESMLQLQAMFRSPQKLLSCFDRVVRKTSAAKNDEACLSVLYEEIMGPLADSQPLQRILIELFTKVSRPWLDYIAEWIGLRANPESNLGERTSSGGFVKIEHREWIDDQGIRHWKPDVTLDFDHIPSFLSPADAHSMFEVGTSLRLLEKHQCDHPLVKAEARQLVDSLTLDWAFTWTDLQQLQAKATKYEKHLRSALRNVSAPICRANASSRTESALEKSAGHDVYGRLQYDVEAQIQASIQTMNEPPQVKVIPSALRLCFDDFYTTNAQPWQHQSISSIPLDLVPQLSLRPMIATQGRLVNRACLSMLFGTHRLREHLRLQWNFQLFGSGVFLSRLSQALFEPNLESAERQQGIPRSGGIMGLRLGVRETWPPASSELRLSLMGVLTETYNMTGMKDGRPNQYDTTAPLPGDLSFSVRDMSEDEIDKCLDADSVEALDFLRLSYKPASPLETVISPISLHKYDQIFKLLLRVIRMQVTVCVIHRDTTDRTSKWHTIDNIAHRFRIEAHHFVSAISAYFFDDGIAIAWRDFERKLDQFEEQLENDYNDIIEQTDGLSQLRRYHEDVLDEIMFSLLLRKRQQPVSKLLEEIFALILQFAKYSRQRAMGSVGEHLDTGTAQELYIALRKKIGIFVTVCKGMGEKRGSVEERRSITSVNGDLSDKYISVEKNTISQLVLRLEMSSNVTAK